MTLPFSQTVTTLKTVSVAEPTSPTVLTSPVGLGETTYRTVNLTGAQLQPVQYINSAMDGNVMYGGARYLVPVQQRAAEQVVYLSQAPRIVQPVYLQNMSFSSDTDVYRHVVSDNSLRNINWNTVSVVHIV